MLTADPAIRHRISVADYHRMGEAGILHEDDRVELIEGELIDMAPIGSRHDGTVNRLARLFQDGAGHSVIVSVQNPVRLDAYSEPQPDLCVLRPREDFYSGSHPGPGDVLLIVEVAESSLAYDRDVKVPLYARHGIPEVWLVDLLARGLHVFRRPEEGRYNEQATPQDLSRLIPLRLEQLAFDLSGLFPAAGER